MTMDVILQQVRVSFVLPVHFTNGVFDRDNTLLASVLSTPPDPKPAAAVVVVDDGVARTHAGLVDRIDGYFQAHAGVLRLGGPVLVIPGGEAAKNAPDTLDRIHTAIHSAALCRHSYVIAVGGGAVLDVVGYAAATAHRGIRLVRIPTTVLAQDDSAVGVKNGVNGFGKKNYYGTFAPPFAVINDFTFLATLEDRDWRGGLSEAVKVALIKDPALFAFIEQHAAALVARDAGVMEQVIRRSAALHVAHIANGGDPFELGSSRPLDFGHWAAHRLEHLTAHRVRHGEAVAIGLALDCTYSRLTGHLAEAPWRRIIDLLIALKLPLSVPELDAHLDAPDHPRSVLRGLAEFREHLGGELTLMMLGDIGRAFDVHEVHTEGMIRSVEILRTIQAAGTSAAASGAVPAAASARGSS